MIMINTDISTLTCWIMWEEYSTLYSGLKFHLDNIFEILSIWTRNKLPGKYQVKDILRNSIIKFAYP